MMVAHSFNVQLFLGFPVDSLYRSLIDRADSALVSLFLQDSGEYLQQIDHEGITYYGKLFDKATLHDLELLENHIFSLLRKLVPDYAYEETSLYLLPHFESR